MGRSSFCSTTAGSYHGNYGPPDGFQFDVNNLDETIQARAAWHSAPKRPSWHSVPAVSSVRFFAKARQVSNKFGQRQACLLIKKTFFQKRLPTAL